jgi:hypothetical protein
LHPGRVEARYDRPIQRYLFSPASTGTSCTHAGVSRKLIAATRAAVRRIIDGTAEQVKSFLQRSALAFIKPRAGHKGDGIFVLRRSG